jgi:hypothetical protein
MQDGTSPCELAFHAENGDPGAQYRLGVLFMLGEQVEQDPEAAYQWLTRAAAAQHSGAQSLVEKLALWRRAAGPAKKRLVFLQRAREMAIPLTVPALRTGGEIGRWIHYGLEIIRSARKRRFTFRIPIQANSPDPVMHVQQGDAMQSLRPS